MNRNPTCQFAQANWGPDSPTGAGDCVAMSLDPDYSGKWLDLPCDTQLAYLCEEKLYGAALTPPGLCPAQLETLPCNWTPEQLVAPSFASVPVTDRDGHTFDLLKVNANPNRTVSCRSGMG